MIDTNALSWKIYEALKENGAGIGNASVPIIGKVLDPALVNQDQVYIGYWKK